MEATPERDDTVVLFFGSVSYEPILNWCDKYYALLLLICNKPRVLVTNYRFSLKVFEGWS